MSPPTHELPAELREAFEAVSRITSELEAAARAGLPERVEQALAERARAIEALETPLQRCGEGPLTPGARSELARCKQRLDAEARRAGHELEQLATRARGALDTIAREGRAIRGYTASSLPAATLNRSG